MAKRVRSVWVLRFKHFDNFRVEVYSTSSVSKLYDRVEFMRRYPEYSDIHYLPVEVN